MTAAVQCCPNKINDGSLCCGQQMLAGAQVLGAVIAAQQMLHCVRSFYIACILSVEFFFLPIIANRN
jgi:hypothetical protein